MAAITTDSHRQPTQHVAPVIVVPPLDIISWTTERSGPIIDGAPQGGAFYYLTSLDALRNDGDILTTIDVLAQKVGILGRFSDWPATTTFYANRKPPRSRRRR